MGAKYYNILSNRRAFLQNKYAKDRWNDALASSTFGSIGQYIICSRLLLLIGLKESHSLFRLSSLHSQLPRI